MTPPQKPHIGHAVLFRAVQWIERAGLLTQDAFLLGNRTTDMYTRTALAIFLLWFAGCTQNSTPGPGKGNQPGTIAGGMAVGSLPSRTPQARNRSFADLPDRGDLVAYPERREVKRDGAYTWHQASLSEEHALRSVGGVMHVTTPSGERLQFQYERHVEHPSGDWSWIGRAQGGEASDEVVLTFGEKAAFGSISQPGKAPLKLMMSGGVSWLIETDRSQIAGIDNPATRPRNPDFLVPPKIRAESGASSESSTVVAATAAATAESVQAAATITVDVLLGYTGGFAAAQGGQSQAVTRLYNMIEITNQAYVNSQVGARVRLVHALQVSYPDSTSNQSALEALTGFRAPNTRTTPDPAFAALRSARDQYGADLVSLVRDFNTPENDGCGIAWLIGGGKSGIDSSDEFFGYSVVSDGRDAGTDGKTYFCREETLAHELGHNMGSQHDRATATESGALKYGVYDYSFGFKTDAGTGNFYTVMTYGDSGQTGYRTFSTPRTTFCGGLPCGIADQADNARSLNNTVPVVSGFRSALAGSNPKSDINGDGNADVIWHNPTQGALAYWLMNGAQVSGSALLTASAGFKLLGVGDFDGNGRAELLWSGNGSIYSSTFTGSGFSMTLIGTHDVGWIAAAADDINGDGNADVIWHNPAQGRLAYWFMEGSKVSASALFTAPVGFKLLGTGDLDGNGRAELLWSGNGSIYSSTFTGTGFTGARIGSHDGGWIAVAADDINGDGKADIIWHNPAQDRLAYWLMNGAQISGSALFSAPAGFKLLGTGDLDGNGRAELLWSGNAAIYSSTFTGTGFAGALIGTHDTGWLPIVNALAQ